MRSATQAKENAVCNDLASHHDGEDVHVFISADIGMIPAGIWVWNHSLKCHEKQSLGELRQIWENDSEVREYVKSLPRVLVPESRIPAFVKESPLFWKRIAQKAEESVLVAA